MTVRTDSGRADSRKGAAVHRPADGTSIADGGTRLRPQSYSPAEVEAALRLLPSHGWTGGWTGRRDRALLVLSQMAGLSYDNIVELTVADVTVADGLATIRTPGGTTTLRMAEDGLICGPCALARWLHALDMRALYPTGRVIAAVIARAARLTSDSPHLCQGTVTVTETTRAMSLLDALNQPVPVATGPLVIERALSPWASSRSLSLSSPGSTQGGVTLPLQRAVTVTGAAPLGSKYSKYARADREPAYKASGVHADGLEGRTRQLLDPRSSDVAAFRSP